MTTKKTPIKSNARKAKRVGFKLVATPSSDRYRFKMATGQIVDQGDMSINFSVFGRNTRLLDYVFVNINNRAKKSYSYNSFSRGEDPFLVNPTKLIIGLGKYRIMFGSQSDFQKIARIMWNNGFVTQKDIKQTKSTPQSKPILSGTRKKISKKSIVSRVKKSIKSSKPKVVNKRGF